MENPKFLDSPKHFNEQELMQKMEELICYGMISSKEYEEISKKYFTLIGKKK